MLWAPLLCRTSPLRFSAAPIWHRSPSSLVNRRLRWRSCCCLRCLWRRRYANEIGNSICLPFACLPACLLADFPLRACCCWCFLQYCVYFTLWALSVHLVPRPVWWWMVCLTKVLSSFVQYFYVRKCVCAESFILLLLSAIFCICLRVSAFVSFNIVVASLFERWL